MESPSLAHAHTRARARTSTPAAISAISSPIALTLPPRAAAASEGISSAALTSRGDCSASLPAR